MNKASSELIQDTNSRKWDRDIAALGNQISAKEDALAKANARIAELEAVLTLFIKYDTGDSGMDEAIKDYHAAMAAAKAAMKDKMK